MKKLLIVALNLLLISSSLWAQAIAPPEISGIVKDTYGKPIAGAEILATQTDIGLGRTVLSNDDGSYILRNLPVGPYTLQVSRKGFITRIQSGIVLTVNGSPIVNPVLTTGEGSEQVPATIKPAFPEARSNGAGQLIDNQRILDFPLNGRKTGELVLLSGAATDAPADDLNSNKNYPATTISIAGGQANSTTYIMDGGSHNDPFNNLSLPMPFPDALREFKVETAAVPAAYSQHAAATVSVATKSGGNSFHGSAFEFLQNDKFNARNYIATAKDNLKRHQWGGTLGGPIMRNKLFFFGGYQYTDAQHSSPTATSRVPTLAMLAGDFTAFASSTCNTKGRVILGLPFVSNKISASSLNQQALNILKIIPTSTDPCGKVQYSLPDNSHEQQFLGRMDFQHSADHSIFGRYYYADYKNPEDFDGTNGLTLSKAGVYNRVYSFVLGDQRILRENLINSLHATILHTTNDRVVPSYFSPQDVGIGAYGPIKGYMGIGVANGFSMGYKDTNPGFFNSTAFQLAEDMDWIRGSHQFTFGANYIQSRINAVNNRLTNGQYTFDGTITGLGLADFLTGNIGIFAQGNPGLDNNRHKYIAFYLQDSWSLNSKLSFQVGFRWEPFIAITHAQGYAQHFEMDWFDDGIDSEIYTKAPDGLRVSGDDGMPQNSNYRTKLAVFSPRLGLAWNPKGDGRLTIRAAAGIMHDTPHLFYTTRFSSSAPWGAQISLTSPDGGLANPWRDYSDGNPFPALNTVSTDMQFPKHGAYVNMPLNLQPTAVGHWNLTIQKIFGQDLVVGASYLGNHTYHGWSVFEANPAVYIAGMCAGGKYGLIKSGYCSQTSNTDYRRKLYTKNIGQGQYYGTIATLDDGGTASYNALQLNAQRRLTGRFNIVANYTLSKCLTDPFSTELGSPTYVNPSNRRDDRGLCASDRQHNLNASILTRLPQFNNSNKAVRAIMGGWQLSTIYSRMTGNPLTITTGIDRAFTGIENQRPNENTSYDEPYAKNRSVDVWLNAKAFSTPDRGKLGNLGVGTALGPDRKWNLNVALMKRIQVYEGHRIEIRAEAFNVLNHPMPANPDTNLSSPTFGLITSAGGDPRIAQFAVKYTF